MRKSTFHLSSSLRARRDLRRSFDITLWENTFGVTVTLKKVYHSPEGPAWITPYRCEQNLLYFLERLNRRIYAMIKRVYSMLGLSYSKPRKDPHFKAIWVLEQDADGRFHYHLALDLPLIVTIAHLNAWVRDLWPKTDWGYTQVDVQSNADQGWIHYITKEVKDDYLGFGSNFEISQTLNTLS